MRLKCLIQEINNQVINIAISQKNHSLKSLLNTSQHSFQLDINISGLSLHSKRTKKDNMFFCLLGTHHDGRKFINEAKNNGAKAVIIEGSIPSKVSKDIIIIRVKDSIKCLGILVNKFYRFPLDKINTTAITGTNGKTTITFLLESILHSYDRAAGVIGTVNHRSNKRIIKAKNTTPDIITIYEFIQQLILYKTRYLIMEVSSHALSQRRIDGMKFDQAIFTNLSQDHLDYHKTMKEYFCAKSLLFKNYLKEYGTAIINADDPFGSKIAKIVKKNKNSLITYGIKKKAQVYAEKIQYKSNCTLLTISSPSGKFRLKTNLIGGFNVYNILAAVSVSLNLRIPTKYIINGLKSVKIPGRLERVSCKRDFDIFVDYAHTDDAIKNILLALRSVKEKGRIIIVFGCGGNRDKTKRPKMGKVASELADFVIITSDNPRMENPKKIIKDIKRGIKKNHYIAIVDRKKAIKKAIDMAQSKDVVVVAGKGHEDYQIIKKRKVAFSDKSIIEYMVSKEIS